MESCGIAGSGEPRASLELIGVSREYRGFWGRPGITAVRNVTVRVSAGEVLAVIGPSGGGKSTLIRLMAGLEIPDAGSVLHAGREVQSIAPHRRAVAFVPQQAALFPQLDVAGNLGFGMEKARGPDRGGDGFRWFLDTAASLAGRKELIRAVANWLELGDRLKSWPSQLSGGEAQRVALGRAVLRNPRLFLLDEPFTAIDLPLRRRIAAELREIVARSGAAMVVVTHDPVEASRLADRIAVLDGGRVVQLGSPRKLLQEPATRTVAELMAGTLLNVLAGTVEIRQGRAVLRTLAGEIGLPYAGWAKDGSRVALAFLPGSVRWAAKRGGDEPPHSPLLGAEVPIGDGPAFPAVKLPSGTVASGEGDSEPGRFFVAAGNAETRRYDTIGWWVETPTGNQEVNRGVSSCAVRPPPGARVSSWIDPGDCLWLDDRTGTKLVKDSHS